MVQISNKLNCLNIVLYDEILASSLDSTTNSWGNLRAVETPHVLKASNEDKSIQCCSFSPNGEYFAVCYNKIIIIYNVPEWNTFCEGTTERKAISIQFFPTSKILLIADKSGCVTFYSYSEGTLKKTDLALGHNSMLTGALVTDDESYIITCDRDEKIRVSNYPNVYNIESYCLGHEQFVSDISFLPADKRILLSSSGDGTVRFWNFVQGQELLQYKSLNKVENEETPIIKIQSFLEEKNISLLAVLEYKLKIVTVLNIKGNLSEGLSYELCKKIELSTTPWDIMLWHGNLVSILPDKTNPINLQLFNEKINEKSFDDVKKYMTDNWESIITASNKIPDTISVLFKREIDNVQEYQERKKARLSKNSKTITEIVA